MRLIPLPASLVEQLQVGQILQKYSDSAQAEFRYSVHAIRPQRGMVDLAIPDDELPKKIMIAEMEVSGVLDYPPVIHQTFSSKLILGKWFIEQP